MLVKNIYADFVAPFFGFVSALLSTFWANSLFLDKGVVFLFTTMIAGVSFLNALTPSSFHTPWCVSSVVILQTAH